jgi:hypothetical protein
MSSFVAFGSQWISLAERSRSSIAFVSILFVGEDLPPPSDDADEGCQWEVQTNEDWVSYWVSQVLFVRGRTSFSRVRRMCLT